MHSHILVYIQVAAPFILLQIIFNPPNFKSSCLITILLVPPLMIAAHVLLLNRILLNLEISVSIKIFYSFILMCMYTLVYYYFFFFFQLTSFCLLGAILEHITRQGYEVSAAQSMQFERAQAEEFLKVSEQYRRCIF